ncbi:hypothetical protein [Sinomonas flava]|uniref:hypothetical protein n=1 Tax=Sinomonas flava TaxID=496857 RepID=UPI0039A75CFC
MNETETLADFFAGPFANPKFTRRSVSIPGDFRTAWRLSVLTLILSRGRANSLALDHLHVLWWAIRSKTTRELFLRWLNGEKQPDELLVRFDPSLTVTIEMALGEELVCKLPSGPIRLETRGTALANVVNANSEVLTSEKRFLENLPHRITQSQINKLLEWA